MVGFGKRSEPKGVNDGCNAIYGLSEIEKELSGRKA